MIHSTFFFVFNVSLLAQGLAKALFEVGLKEYYKINNVLMFQKVLLFILIRQLSFRSLEKMGRPNNKMMIFL